MVTDSEYWLDKAEKARKLVTTTREEGHIKVDIIKCYEHLAHCPNRHCSKLYHLDNPTKRDTFLCYELTYDNTGKTHSAWKDVVSTE